MYKLVSFWCLSSIENQNSKLNQQFKKQTKSFKFWFRIKTSWFWVFIFKTSKNFFNERRQPKELFLFRIIWKLCLYFSSFKTKIPFNRPEHFLLFLQLKLLRYRRSFFNPCSSYWWEYGYRRKLWMPHLQQSTFTSRSTWLIQNKNDLMFCYFLIYINCQFTKWEYQFTLNFQKIIIFIQFNFIMSLS